MSDGTDQISKEILELFETPGCANGKVLQVYVQEGDLPSLVFLKYPKGVKFTPYLRTMVVSLSVQHRPDEGNRSQY